jgi:transmembrane sensor
MKKDLDKDDLLGRWLGGTLSEEEKKELREHPDFREYEELVQAVDQFRAPDFDSDASLAKLKAKRKGRTPEPSPLKPVKRSIRPLLWWGAAAAVVLVLFGLWYFLPGSDQEFRALAGNTEMAEFSDGSTVRLNAVTTVVKQYDKTDRRISLEGEAYFDVVQDGRPFRVMTALGQVTVLGTSFNVYSRDEEMRVSCQSGKVEVSFHDQPEAYTLLPGESVSLLPNGTASQDSIATDEVLDWLAGRSVFNLRPIGEVIAELERQFDLTIEVPAGFDLTQRIQTAFPHGNVDTALEISLGPLEQVSFDRTGKTVRLYTN